MIEFTKETVLIVSNSPDSMNKHIVDARTELNSFGYNEICSTDLLGALGALQGAKRLYEERYRQKWQDKRPHMLEEEWRSQVLEQSALTFSRFPYKDILPGLIIVGLGSSIPDDAFTVDFTDEARAKDLDNVGFVKRLYEEYHYAGACLVITPHVDGDALGLSILKRAHSVPPPMVMDESLLAENQLGECIKEAVQENMRWHTLWQRIKHRKPFKAKGPSEVHP